MEWPDDGRGAAAREGFGQSLKDIGVMASVPLIVMDNKRWREAAGRTLGPLVSWGNWSTDPAGATGDLTFGFIAAATTKGLGRGAGALSGAALRSATGVALRESALAAGARGLEGVAAKARNWSGLDLSRYAPRGGLTPALAGAGVPGGWAPLAKLGGAADRLDSMAGVLQSKAASRVGAEGGRLPAPGASGSAGRQGAVASLPEGFGAPTAVVSKTYGTNTATYVVDAATRHPINVEAAITTVYKGRVRSSVELRLQSAAARLGLVDDHGGHLTGHRFIPEGMKENLIPQNSNLNTSAWKTMENEWADWARAGMEVRVKIDVIRSDSLRPDRLRVHYEVVDPMSGERVGAAVSRTFDNRAHEAFDRVSREEMNRMIRKARG